MSTSASSSAKQKESEPDAAALVAAASVAREQRQRRRRGAGLRGYGDEFMEMNINIEPEWGAPPDLVASDLGAGPLGFAGTVHKERVAAAAGLTTLAGDDFGGGPTMPMVPASWNPEQAGAGEKVGTTADAATGNGC
jgi:PPE-repeat protein